jgi:hypothetical protein
VNPSEAAQLLAHCAAFDNRTVGKADSRAWAAALRDVPLDQDALEAVARFYGTPSEKPGDRLWIQPHNVRAHRLSIRKERLGETLPAYEPPTEPETGAEFIARRRAQLDAVATGRARGIPVGELTGAPHPSVAKRLKDLAKQHGQIGHEVPDIDGADDDADVEEIRRPGPLGVQCPTCRAPIGHRCKAQLPGSGDRRPRELATPHAARRRVASGGPAQLESPQEIEHRRAASLARLAQLAAKEEPA